MSNGFAALVGELAPWATEKEQLRSGLPVEGLAPFGGLTWDQMEQVLRRYEGRSSALTLFQLARDWKKAGDSAKYSPDLLRRGVTLTDTAIRAGSRRQLDALGDAAELLGALDRKNLGRAFGHHNWWKMHALVYMLKHPQPAYRTRDLRAHLGILGLKISSLDFRRFCKRHGIKRDQRAGRPKVRIGKASRRLEVYG